MLTVYKLAAKETYSLPEIAAKLNQFDWSYRKHSFPKLKDGGHADARIADTSVRSCSSQVVLIG
jgi:hypothetical protein